MRFVLQIIDEEILCVHGGLSPDVKTLDQVSPSLPLSLPPLFLPAVPSPFPPSLLPPPHSLCPIAYMYMYMYSTKHMPCVLLFVLSLQIRTIDRGVEIPHEGAFCGMFFNH